MTNPFIVDLLPSGFALCLTVVGFLISCDLLTVVGIVLSAIAWGMLLQQVLIIIPTTATKNRAGRPVQSAWYRARVTNMRAAASPKPLRPLPAVSRANHLSDLERAFRLKPGVTCRPCVY
jgi:hypothetical protein